MSTTVNTIDAGVLSIRYLEYGLASGWPCILGHGFPYDVHAYSEAAPILAEAGARVIVPYLRGFGPTRFLSAETPRSGEQGALGADLLALLDGSRSSARSLAAMIGAGERLASSRPSGLNALSRSSPAIPITFRTSRARWSRQAPPRKPRWYQYYFHSERGQRGLTNDRRAITRLLWRMWSPTWAFDDATFERTASAFDNPDFVEVVIHSYRHRFGLAPGDPRYAAVEAALAAQPLIAVAAITIDGDADGVNPGTKHHAVKFVGAHEHRFFRGAGHILPQERSVEWARAVIDARAMAL